MTAFNLDSLPNRPLTDAELDKIESVVDELTASRRGSDQPTTSFFCDIGGERYIIQLTSNGWVAEPILEIDSDEGTVWWDRGANV